MPIRDVRTLKKKVGSLRVAQSKSMATLLASDPEAVRKWFTREPEELASLLSLAANQLVQGKVSAKEAKSLVQPFIINPAFLSRLLSGTGA